MSDKKPNLEFFSVKDKPLPVDGTKIVAKIPDGSFARIYKNIHTGNWISKFELPTAIKDSDISDFAIWEDPAPEDAGHYFYSEDEVFFGKKLSYDGMWHNLIANGTDKVYHVREDHIFDNVHELFSAEAAGIKRDISHYLDVVAANELKLSKLWSKCANITHRITSLWKDTMGGSIHPIEDYFSGYYDAKGTLMPPIAVAVFIDKNHPQIKVLKKARVDVYFFESSTFKKL